METPPPLYIDNFSELIDRYDGFLIDLWGVIHDGIRPYPGVLDSLSRIKQQHKKVVFVSNSPCRAAAVAEDLEEMGIPLDASQALLTAGEETFQALTHRTGPYGDFGFFYAPMEPADLPPLLENSSFERAPSLDKASFLLNTGLATSQKTVADYIPFLKQAFMLRLPMVCANPDRVGLEGDKKSLCAGALASFYEGLGGTVHYHGKPTPAIYQEAFNRLKPLDRPQILALGDSFETDVWGAFRAGIDVAFVPGGIHREELKTQIGILPPYSVFQTFAEGWSFGPTYVIPGLNT